MFHMWFTTLNEYSHILIKLKLMSRGISVKIKKKLLQSIHNFHNRNNSLLDSFHDFFIQVLGLFIPPVYGKISSWYWQQSKRTTALQPFWVVVRWLIEMLQGPWLNRNVNRKLPVKLMLRFPLKKSCYLFNRHDFSPL